jgi:hypothetical protein
MYHVAVSMRNLAPLVLLFALPLSAQRIDTMKPATFAELAGVAVAPPAGVHRPHSSRPLVAKRAPLGAIVPQVVVAPYAAAAPPVTLGFKATSSPLPGSTTGINPADPSGAVGPQHVVGAFNNSVTVHDRGGRQLAVASTTQFWHDPAFPDTLQYSPRVLYDGASDRWIIAMLTDDGTLQNGALLLAISSTGDPTGTWRRYRSSISGDTRVSADGLRAVLTGSAIVLTANEYLGNDLNGVDVFQIPRATAYGSGAPPGSRTHFNSLEFDFTPVASNDATARYFTNAHGFLEQFQIDSTGKLVNFQSYASPPGLSYEDMTCDQLGAPNSIDCGLGQLQYALLRDGVTWVVQIANDGTRSVVLVWKIAGSKTTTYVLSDPAFDDSFPSIAVNRAGTALVGYATFSLNTFPSAEYRTIDAAGNVSAPVTVKSGEDFYNDFYWGFYSTTVVDPADDLSFWTLQSYSTPPVNFKFFTWGAWWSYVRIGASRPRAVRH